MRSVLLLVLGLLLIFTSSALALPELKTAEYVDLMRYLGEWYAVGEIPQWFNRNCVGSTAHYSLSDEGHIVVVNTCYRGDLSGRMRTVQARANVVDEETNARLEVRFFVFVRGDYWIMEIADDYSYAVVGEPSRKFLWILSREKEMEEELYMSILERVEEQGYDVSKIRKPWDL